MADKKPLKRDGGITTEFGSGDTLGIANGGTNAATKGGAVANLLRETVTIANCANTSAETTVLSVTIPANTWADGEEVRMVGAFKHKQNSSVSRNLTLKVKVGGTSYTMLSASAVADNATEGKSTRSFGFLRVGSEVWGNFATNGVGLAAGTIIPGSTGISLNQFSSSSGNTWTGVDFTSAITIEFTVQWSTANSNVYFNPQVGTCKKL